MAPWCTLMTLLFPKESNQTSSTTSFHVFWRQKTREASFFFKEVPRCQQIKILEKVHKVQRTDRGYTISEEKSSNFTSISLFPSKLARSTWGNSVVSVALRSKLWNLKPVFHRPLSRMSSLRPSNSWLREQIVQFQLARVASQAASHSVTSRSNSIWLWQPRSRSTKVGFTSLDSGILLFKLDDIRLKHETWSTKAGRDGSG